jgi:hypothetical protein
VVLSVIFWIAPYFCQRRTIRKGVNFSSNTIHVSYLFDEFMILAMTLLSVNFDLNTEKINAKFTVERAIPDHFSFAELNCGNL